MTIAIKLVKIDSKIIISLPQSKMVKQTEGMTSHVIFFLIHYPLIKRSLQKVVHLCKIEYYRHETVDLIPILWRHLQTANMSWKTRKKKQVLIKQLSHNIYFAFFSLFYHQFSSFSFCLFISRIFQQVCIFWVENKTR